MKFDPAEIALILEQAKHEAKKKQLASKEQNVITWDGNTEGKKELPAGDNIVLYKVSDAPVKITKDNVKKILLNDGRTADQIAEEQNGTISVASQSDENGATLTAVAVVAGAYTTQFVAVADDDMYSDGILVIEKGVYFLGIEKTGVFVSAIELETIHPIPQEYIPPLDALYMNGTDGVKYKLYVDAAGPLQVEVV